MRLLTIILCCALTGCGDAYDRDYWQQTGKPLALIGVFDVDPVLCNAKEINVTTLGCAWRLDDAGIAVIHLHSRLTGECRACVLSHEEKHVEGWTHSPVAREVVRCGDGRMLRCSV
jgi:hypothetical protein